MSGSWSHGKGDATRGDRNKFRYEYDRIFNRCPDHPAYVGKGKPKTCEKCWEIYRAKRSTE